MAVTPRGSTVWLRLSALLVIACCCATLELASVRAAAVRLGSGAATDICSFRRQTGFPCIGCGGTHALAKMSRGDLAGAIAENPLGASAGLALWLLAASAVLTALSGRAAFLGRAVLLVVVAAPAAFVWGAFWWWTSLPPGAVLVR